jgi:glycerophosphoryl diester phosphodiesterase
MPSRPQVVAHRGASHTAPEHTLSAYVAALEEGADALECDVRRTRDGVLVCAHDRTVDRTSSGRGALSRFTLAELAELDFGVGFAGEAPDRERHRVLTLARLFETVADCGRRVEIAVETKHPTRYSGLVEVDLVELLERFGWAGRSGEPSPVRVMSFATSSLRRIRALAPALATVQLLWRLPLRYRSGLLPPYVSIAGPALRAVKADPAWVARAHAGGRPVHVWTVNEEKDVRFVAGLGVEAIITDRPAAVRAMLD